MKEVLNNDNTVEPKTFHESSDSNRSITCSGKTIHYLSKPVLCLDEENMDMNLNVDNVNKHIVMNNKNYFTYLSNNELELYPTFIRVLTILFNL